MIPVKNKFYHIVYKDNRAPTSYTGTAKCTGKTILTPSEEILYEFSNLQTAAGYTDVALFSEEDIISVAE